MLLMSIEKIFSSIMITTVLIILSDSEIWFDKGSIRGLKGQLWSLNV